METFSDNSSNSGLSSPFRGTGGFAFLLYLADNALILGQRNAEWTGHGPVLEQDIALTNISLDLIGQARNLCAHAAAIFNSLEEREKKALDHLLPQPWKAYGRELKEDDIAFLRTGNQYLNLLLCELPRGDWAFTILRQFFFSAYQAPLYRQLQTASYPQLAAIAEKSGKEVTYHLRWSSEWVIRLGDGTTESNRRIQNALTGLWPYTGEAFVETALEQEAAAAGIALDLAAIKEAWEHTIFRVFEDATLPLPGTSLFHRGGKEGKHTEYLQPLLDDMQQLQRTYPNATW